MAANCSLQRTPKLLKWVQEDSGYPAQQTRKEKLRKVYRITPGDRAADVVSTLELAKFQYVDVMPQDQIAVAA